QSGPWSKPPMPRLLLLSRRQNKLNKPNLRPKSRNKRLKKKHPPIRSASLKLTTRTAQLKPRRKNASKQGASRHSASASRRQPKKRRLIPPSHLKRLQRKPTRRPTARPRLAARPPKHPKQSKHRLLPLKPNLKRPRLKPKPSPLRSRRRRVKLKNPGQNSLPNPRQSPNQNRTKPPAAELLTLRLPRAVPTTIQEKSA